MKKTAILLLSLLLISFKAFARDGFAIVIDPKSYSEAKAEVGQYANAVEQLHGLKVYTVIDKWGVPDSIRATLIRLHNQKNEPVIGCVLIGDIPVAMVRDAQHMTSAFKMNQQSPRKQSSVPSDRFYDDFALKFKYLDRDSDAQYFYYSLTAESAQRLHPDIYSGRIRPTDVGGTSRYQKLRDYLRKLVTVKNSRRKLQQMFFFSGHGYISDSKVARMDEKVAWQEHFPQLKGRVNAISYMDHSDHYPVRVNVMNEVMRTDLDLAVLHHHGAPETEYFNGSAPISSVRQAKEYIRQNVREHIVDAKERGRDWEATRKSLVERFDLPQSWVADVFDSALNAKDSADYAETNLNLEDFALFGYKPNAPVVLIDACYCGSFHQNDCIANEYIFQPGSTVAVVANTVNVLQDKWSDRLIGLIAEGGCVGDIVRFSTYLESHVIGDPTYRFVPSDGQGIDIDHLVNENKPATWERLLKSDKPDLQSLAIEQLCNSGKMTSARLKDIYTSSPYGIVRLMALKRIVDFNDDNSVEVIRLASQDSYEMLQRQALIAIHGSGDNRLIPALIKVSISNNTSDRVNFDAQSALAVMPEDKLLAEFHKQFDSPSVCYIDKDSVGRQIEKAIRNSAEMYVNELKELRVDTIKPRAKFWAIRSQRNNLVHAYAPYLIDYAKTGTKDVEFQTMVMEALGWFPYSYQAPFIAREVLAISKDPSFAEPVRNEALKTYNRLMAR